MKTTTLETESYRISHGKEPRGKGRWAFAASKTSAPVFAYGTLREAAEIAAAQLGVTRLIVCP